MTPLLGHIVILARLLANIAVKLYESYSVSERNHNKKRLKKRLEHMTYDKTWHSIMYWYIRKQHLTMEQSALNIWI